MLPAGRLTASSSEHISLARLSRESAEKALAIMGVNPEKLSSYATLARRSLTALRRKMAIAPASLTPAWAKDPTEGRKLLAPLFVDTWNDSSEGDRNTLSRLAGTTYEDVQQTVLRWEVAPDPPVRRVGNVWMIASRDDAWRLLSRFVTEDDLRRFEVIALDVLATHDPTLGMSSVERILAGMQGNVLQQTGLLRKGIAGSLAIMATLSDTLSFATSTKGVNTATRIVRELLCEKGKNDIATWDSLDHCLLLLAEAAPTVFLDAVEAGLQGDTPLLVGMFQDKEDDYFGRSSPHTYLLWALETLAWNAEYLGRAALCLAKLVRLDPGGRLGNRPGRGLRDIFLCWHPHTSATATKRLNILEMLYRREATVTWQLMVSLLPKDHDTTSHTAKPDWRDWVPESYGNQSYREFFETTTTILERLLECAGHDAKRWLDLIASAQSLFSEQREALLAKTETLDVSLFSDDDKMKLRDALRKEITHHREFPDAEWVMPDDHLERLDVFFERLLPGDIRIRHRWLFQQWIPIPDLDRHDWDERQRRTWQLRAEALKEIIGVHGLAEVIAFSQYVKEPGLVGETLGREIMPEEQHNAFLKEHLGTPEQWRDRMVSGFVIGCSFAFGNAWVQPRVDAAKAAELLSASQWGEFFLSVPFGLVPVNDIDALPEGAQHIFWKRINNIRFSEIPDETDRIVQRLIQFGRPEVSIDTIDYTKDKTPALLSPERIAEVLEACLQVEDIVSVVKRDSFPYHTSELFDHLDESGFDRDRLARLELNYLAIHQHQRRPKLLHKDLAENPTSFVDVLKLIYKPSKEIISESDEGEVGDEETINENQVAMAQVARQLLQDWHLMPGRQEDGTVNSGELYTWAVSTRALARDAGLSQVADIYIGRVISYSPHDPDGAWPHQAVRDLIEDLANPSIESAWRTQTHNNRGVTMRGLTDGGDQERSLVDRYSGYAAQIEDIWPRTAATLRNLVGEYVMEAEGADINAELRQDMWR